jgi:four helix bundle protein
MAETRYARSHRELIVYQKARALAREIFEITRQFPREESYSLTDQVRRSSRSVGAQVAVAWAKRAYEKHFISMLTDADGEQHETQHWIEIARDCGYISDDQSTFLLEKCREIGRLLGSMIDKAALFCNPSARTIHETSGEYFTLEPDNQKTGY